MAAKKDRCTKESVIRELYRHIDEKNEEGYAKTLTDFLCYAGSEGDMVEIATTITENGESLRDRTLSHPNLVFLQLLIHSCFRWSIVSQNIDKMDEFFKKTLECTEGGTPQTGNFLQWAQRHIKVDGATKRCKYMMLKQPSILIVPYTDNRLGAAEETAALVDCFRKLGWIYTLKPDLSPRELFREIQKAQDSEFGQYGQMVFIMGHGYQGHILDNERHPVPIIQIHLAMCPRSHIGTPKVLVVQACQVVPPEMERASDFVLFENNSLEDADDGQGKPNTAPLTSYVYQEDSYLICSAIPGERSKRNTFLPLLAEALVANKHECIRDVFRKAKIKLTEEVGACPFARSQLRASLCFGEIYDLQ